MANTKKGPAAKPAHAPLDNLFHYASRGGTFGGEIGAGVLMGILAVCCVFMNMQLVTPLGLAEDASAATIGEAYALTYFVSMMATLVGTFVAGLVTRLPLVQTTSLGLSLVLVSGLGAATDLTFENLLFVNLVSSVALVVVAVVPAVRDFCLKALPAPVRHALPAAMGLVVTWVAAQLSGILTVAGSGLPAYGPGMMAPGASSSAMTARLIGLGGYSFENDAFHPQLSIAAIAVVGAIVVYLMVRNRCKHPLLVALLAATIGFLVADVLLVGVNWRRTKLTTDFALARAWMIGSEDAMQLHLSAVMYLLSPATILTRGTDFSAYVEAGGNVPLLFCSALVTYLMLNFSNTMAVLDGLDNEFLPAMVREDGQLVAGKSVRKSLATDKGFGLALLATSVGNLVAAMLGASPVGLSPVSVSGAKDRARSGLASVVAAVIVAASCFVWVVPAIFCVIPSYNIQMSQYGHYGVVLAYLTQCNFALVDVVLLVTGVAMAVRAAMHAVAAGPVRGNDATAFAVTVVATLLTTNLACGMAAGTVAFAAVRLVPARASRASAVERLGGVPSLVWCACSLVLLALNLAL